MNKYLVSKKVGVQKSEKLQNLEKYQKKSEKIGKFQKKLENFRKNQKISEKNQNISEKNRKKLAIFLCSK